MRIFNVTESKTKTVQMNDKWTLDPYSEGFPYFYKRGALVNCQHIAQFNLNWAGQKTCLLNVKKCMHVLQCLHLRNHMKFISVMFHIIHTGPAKHREYSLCNYFTVYEANNLWPSKNTFCTIQYHSFTVFRSLHQNWRYHAIQRLN